MRLELPLPLLGLLLCAAPEIPMELVVSYKTENHKDKLVYSDNSRVRVPPPREFMRFSLQKPVGTAAQEDEAQEEEFLVEISGTTVTITCPLAEGNIKWEGTGGTTSPEEVRKYIIKDHDSSPANLSCSSGTKKHELYLNARVCANCEELDALTATGIIVADLLITLGVLILVYYFSKGRKGKASTSPASRPRGQKTQRPPPVPNPDYEPIRKGQREVYAGLESRGF